MKADPFVQLRLLDLQDLDSRLHRLEVRRAGLPAQSKIAEADRDLAVARGELVAHETEVSDRGRVTAKLETDIEQVRARATRDQQRLESGAVPAKEMSSMQHEIESLARRQAALEDEELEVLELREQAERAAAQARTLIEQLEAARSAAVEERDRELAAIDAEAASLVTQRDELAPALPADLVALYDRLRAGRGGVGAAPLVRRRCEGCHLELAGNDLAGLRAAAADDVVRHEDCGRILVRTAESGL